MIRKLEIIAYTLTLLLNWNFGATANETTTWGGPFHGAFFSLLSLFKKMKVGLRDLHAVCEFLNQSL
jgi:hypothetical protein